MQKSPRYFCIYCDLSGNEFDLIRDHIQDYHKVKKVKPIDTQEIIHLG